MSKVSDKSTMRTAVLKKRGKKSKVKHNKLKSTSQNRGIIHKTILKSLHLERADVVKPLSSRMSKGKFVESSGNIHEASKKPFYQESADVTCSSGMSKGKFEDSRRSLNKSSLSIIDSQLQAPEESAAQDMSPVTYQGSLTVYDENILAGKLTSTEKSNSVYITSHGDKHSPCLSESLELNPSIYADVERLACSVNDKKLSVWPKQENRSGPELNGKLFNSKLKHFPPRNEIERHIVPNSHPGHYKTTKKSRKKKQKKKLMCQAAQESGFPLHSKVSKECTGVSNLHLRTFEEVPMQIKVREKLNSDLSMQRSHPSIKATTLSLTSYPEESSPSEINVTSENCGSKGFSAFLQEHLVEHKLPEEIRPKPVKKESSCKKRHSASSFQKRDMCYIFVVLDKGQEETMLKCSPQLRTTRVLDKVASVLDSIADENDTIGPEESEILKKPLGHAREPELVSRGVSPVRCVVLTAEKGTQSDAHLIYEPQLLSVSSPVPDAKTIESLNPETKIILSAALLSVLSELSFLTNASLKITNCFCEPLKWAIDCDSYTDDVEALLCHWHDNVSVLIECVSKLDANHILNIGKKELHRLWLLHDASLCMLQTYRAMSSGSVSPAFHQQLNSALIICAKIILPWTKVNITYWVSTITMFVELCKKLFTLESLMSGCKCQKDFKALLQDRFCRVCDFLCLYKENCSTEEQAGYSRSRDSIELDVSASKEAVIEDFIPNFYCFLKELEGWSEEELRICLSKHNSVKFTCNVDSGLFPCEEHMSAIACCCFMKSKPRKEVNSQLQSLTEGMNISSGEGLKKPDLNTVDTSASTDILPNISLNENKQVQESEEDAKCNNLSLEVESHTENSNQTDIDQALANDGSSVSSHDFTLQLDVSYSDFDTDLTVPLSKSSDYDHNISAKNQDIKSVKEKQSTNRRSSLESPASTIVLTSSSPSQDDFEQNRLASENHSGSAHFGFNQSTPFVVTKESLKKSVNQVKKGKRGVDQSQTYEETDTESGEKRQPSPSSKVFGEMNSLYTNIGSLSEDSFTCFDDSEDDNNSSIVLVSSPANSPKSLNKKTLTKTQANSDFASGKTSSIDTTSFYCKQGYGKAYENSSAKNSGNSREKNTKVDKRTLEPDFQQESVVKPPKRRLLSLSKQRNNYFLDNQLLELISPSSKSPHSSSHSRGKQGAQQHTPQLMSQEKTLKTSDVVREKASETKSDVVACDATNEHYNLENHRSEVQVSDKGQPHHSKSYHTKVSSKNLENFENRNGVGEDGGSKMCNDGSPVRVKVRRKHVTFIDDLNKGNFMSKDEYSSFDITGRKNFKHTADMKNERSTCDDQPTLPKEEAFPSSPMKGENYCKKKKKVQKSLGQEKLLDAARDEHYLYSEDCSDQGSRKKKKKKKKEVSEQHENTSKGKKSRNGIDLGSSQKSKQDTFSNNLPSESVQCEADSSTLNVNESGDWRNYLGRLKKQMLSED